MSAWTMIYLTLLPVVLLATAITILAMALGYAIAFVVWAPVTMIRQLTTRVKITVHPTVKPVVNEYWYPQQVKIRLGTA